MSNQDAALAVKVAEARNRLATGAFVSATGHEGAEPTVQLSIRVPASVREHVHAAAAAEGLSTQSWLSAVVGAAVAGVLTPQGRAAAILVEEARRQLEAAVASGSYAAVVEGLEDPDLQ